MDFKDDSFTSFMPEHLLKIITALEKDGILQPWKLIRNSDSFTLIVNFPAKGGNKGNRKPLKERASGRNSVGQHTDKKHQDSSGVRLAEQPKRKKKKSPARIARDRARRKAYWKDLKIARKLGAENTAAHYAQLQETRTVASPQVSVDSHPENSGCMERTPNVSELQRHLTVEHSSEPPQVQLDLNELSSDASSGSSLDSDDDVDACDFDFEMPDICASCNMGPPEVTLKKCTRCKLSKYCSVQCQRDNWKEHKFACSIVASQRMSK